jgi:hypothetical protein
VGRRQAFGRGVAGSRKARTVHPSYDRTHAPNDPPLQ